MLGDTSRSAVSGDFSSVLPPEGEFQAHFDTVAGGRDVFIQQRIGVRISDRYQLTFTLADLGGLPNGFSVYYRSVISRRI